MSYFLHFYLKISIVIFENSHNTNKCVYTYNTNTKHNIQKHIIRRVMKMRSWHGNEAGCVWKWSRMKQVYRAKVTS